MSKEQVKNKKMTGEQIEKILDICNQHGMFDYFFAPKENTFTEQEEIVLKKIFNDKKLLEKNYEPNEQEKVIWKKLCEQSQKEEYEFKKTLITNKELSKLIYNILEPELEFDIKQACNVISRGLASIKTEIFL